MDETMRHTFCFQTLHNFLFSVTSKITLQTPATVTLVYEQGCCERGLQQIFFLIWVGGFGPLGS